MPLYDLYVGGLNFWGILFAVIVFSVFIFVLYWLWTCPCNDVDGANSNCSQRQKLLPQQSIVPLYALELEPGIVVLQSEDGEIFRVLREYDSVGRTGSGSPPLPNTVSSNSASSSDFHYVPSCTRAHYQTRPTAPPLSQYTDIETELDTSNPFGDGAPWRPLKTINR